MTNWFDVEVRVKQCCLLSKVLFDMFVNCIVNDLKQINCGVIVLDTKIGQLMYADDIVLFAENESSLHKVLDCDTTWTEKMAYQFKVQSAI